MTKTTSLGSNTLHGFAWVFVGTLGNNILKLVSVAILARLLLPEDFGIVTASMIIISFIKIFSDLGVAPAVVQKKALSQTDIKTANTLSLALGAIAGFCIFATAGMFEQFMKMQGLAEIIYILALTLPIAGMTVVGQALLQRKLQFKKIVLCLLLAEAFGTLFIAIPLALLDFSYYSLVYGSIAQAIALMLLVHLLVPEVRGYSFNKASSKSLLNFGLGQTLGKLANYISTQIDKLVLGRYLGVNALGSYDRAYVLLMIPAGLLGTTIDKVLFPVISKIQDDDKKIAKIFMEATAFLAMLCVPLTVVLTVYADSIIKIILGEGWSLTVPALQALGAVLFFRTSYKLSDSLVRAKGAVYRRAWRQFVYAAMVLVGVIIGMNYGIKGASIGVALAIVGNYFMMLVLSNKLIGLNMLNIARLFIKHGAVLALVFSCSVYFRNTLATYDINVFVQLILGVFFSFALSLVMYLSFFPLFKDEFNLLLNIKKKFIG